MQLNGTHCAQKGFFQNSQKRSYFMHSPSNMAQLMSIDLFSNIDTCELSGLLECVGARCVEYKAGDFIIEESAITSEFGIMLTGRGRSIKWDASGKIVTITLIEPGGVMGVMLVAKGNRKSPVAVQATQNATVMLIPFNNLLSRCNKNCPQHEQLLKNYIGAVAEKGLELHERINCLLKPSAREKIISYLQRVSREHQSKIFAIPMNRNAMAEYLNIERSALSRELSRMKKDGVIEYRKSEFELL